MKVSNKGLAEIASHEGIVQMPYKDSTGVWTFGVGHTRLAGEPDPDKMAKGVAVSIEEVMDLFAKDIKKYEAAVNQRLGQAHVEQHEFDAAVSFHYNTGGISRASWVKYWIAGDMSEAYRRMMFWNKPSEIIPRRKKEAELFKRGKYGDGRATVYPATASGRVLWSKGKRVNVLDYLDKEPAAKPAAPTETKEKPMFAAFDGYKTYVVVALVLLLVVVEKFLGIDVPGFDVQQDWVGWVLGALGLGALRSGVKKAE